jgi:N-acetylmuramoyl-L-alanine amidase
MRPLSARQLRRPALAVGVATLVLGVAAPAYAAPADVTGLAAALAPHGLQLTWSGGSTGTPVVRDVTGLSGPYDPATSGRLVTASPTSACPAATCVLDTAFANTSSATYVVWARDADGTTSAVGTVLTVGPLTRVATATTLNPLPDAVLAGHAVVLVGKITWAGLPLAAAKLQLRSRVAGGTSESLVATLTSGADGSVSASYVPARTRTYRLLFAGDPYSTPSTSVVRVVSMQPRLLVSVSPSTIPWKKSSTLSGVVAPNLAGRIVTVQTWYAGAWRSVARRTLTSTSTWSYSVSPSVGRHGYRVVLPAAVGYRSAVSAGVVVTVVPRALYQGLSGPDVLALEHRLAAQHYLVGRVDGYFDSNLRHAVIAFEKVQGLPRLQRWTAAEMTRVLHPLAFKVRYPSSATTVEVDITRQVLVISKAGVISTIVDVSTGSEKVYYLDGVRNIAHTPRGHFSIFHKIDGIRISKLGELYKPSYFYKGWAIHGNSSVPTYPASHGCVRITNYAADRLFARLAIGVPVAVYDE